MPSYQKAREERKEGREGEQGAGKKTPSDPILKRGSDGKVPFREQTGLLAVTQVLKVRLVFEMKREELSVQTNSEYRRYGMGEQGK